jgi:hypothetical protein
MRYFIFVERFFAPVLRVVFFAPFFAVVLRVVVLANCISPLHAEPRIGLAKYCNPLAG